MLKYTQSLFSDFQQNYDNTYKDFTYNDLTYNINKCIVT